MVACGVDLAKPSGALAVAKFAKCMYSLPKAWMTDAGYVRQCAEAGFVCHCVLIVYRYVVYRYTLAHPAPWLPQELV